MKKNYINILKSVSLAVLLAMSASSCEDMLDEKKSDFIEPTDIEDSDDGASQWVIGTYSKLADDMFRWNIFPPAIEFDCDYMTGPDWSFGTLGAGNFQNNDYTEAMWTKPYAIIHRANLSIENINKMQNVSADVKSNALGELYFLKAYSYFLLVRAFGDVPIHNVTVNNGGDIYQPRQSIETVYAHIIDLLQQAETMMYKNTDASFVEGRASAGAAASLLAKVYLTIGSGSLPSGNVAVRGGTAYTMNGNEKVLTNPISFTVAKTLVKGYENFDSKEYFKLARDKANEVITGVYGSYGLLSFDALWTQASKNKTEHIWSLQTIAADEKYGMTFSRAYCGMYNAKGNITTGLWWGCRDHWYKLFESKDYRITKGVIHRWVREPDDTSWGDGGSYYPNTEEWEKKAKGYTDDDGNWVAPVAPFNDGKSYRSGVGSAWIAYLTKYSYVTDNTQERTDANWPFLRYADVLLIYAEAANEYENSNAARSLALAKLNEVRERSNATPRYLTGAGNIDTQESFRSAVLEERAMELALEGDRRWDLIRWGIYLDVMNKIGGYDEVNVNKARSDKHLLYPIPKSEMDTNPLITSNNPGWN